MAWKLLPTNYTDAVWSGLKKYSQVNNSDGTVSFQDVTVYTGKETSFFGAKDANRMNEALNTIMSMVENGTNLYEAFQIYFTDQKRLFTGKANSVIENVRTLTNKEYDSYRVYVEGLKKDGDSSLAQIETSYSQRMTAYETQQKALFDSWFANVKNQLTADVAGHIQSELTEVDERLSHLEYMTIQNDFTAPIAVDKTEQVLLTDDLGNAIVADWQH